MLVELFWRSCFRIVTMACSDPGQHAMGSNGALVHTPAFWAFCRPKLPTLTLHSHPISVPRFRQFSQGRSLTRQREIAWGVKQCPLARGSEETHDLVHERTWYRILSSSSFRRSSIMVLRELGVSLAITIASHLPLRMREVVVLPPLGQGDERAEEWYRHYRAGHLEQCAVQVQHGTAAQSRPVPVAVCSPAQQLTLGLGIDTIWIAAVASP
jgi:hypothetical protein